MRAPAATLVAPKDALLRLPGSCRAGRVLTVKALLSRTSRRRAVMRGMVSDSVPWMGSHASLHGKMLQGGRGARGHGC